MDTAAGISEAVVSFSFINWQKLTDRNAQVRMGPLMDGLAAATDFGSDLVLSAEVGATAQTMDPRVQGFEADWESRARSVLGVGVGGKFGI